MFLLWKFYAYSLYKRNKRPGYFQAYLEICRALKTGSSLLHVGCGVRTFEELLSHDRRDIEVEAVDFHRRLMYSRFTRFENQIQYGKDLDLGFRQDQSRRFDFILLEQTFAGIPRHDYHVADMRRLLRDGGELIAIVASRPSSFWLRSLRWLLNIPQTPYFNRDTLCQMFDTNRVLRIEGEPFWLIRAIVHHNQQNESFIERPSTCECREMSASLLCR